VEKMKLYELKKDTKNANKGTAPAQDAREFAQKLRRRATNYGAGSGRASNNVAAGNLIDPGRSGLPHDRLQFAAKNFENRLNTRLTKGS
jgi:hypothetical protein